MSLSWRSLAVTITLDFFLWSLSMMSICIFYSSLGWESFIEMQRKHIHL